MNNPSSNNAFVPKQALAPTPELYDELVADGMQKLASATLSHLPPISTGATIHDNGCGTGAATAAIIAALPFPQPQISIKGTDINAHALSIYTQQADAQRWPAEAINMDSTTLSFPDATFTHSISNALLFVLPDDGVPAVKETYRTLKPGGIAAFNSWSYVPTLEPIQITAKATRPPVTPLPRQGMQKWSEASFLQSVVEKGGFEKEKVRVVESEVFVVVEGMERYANMLWSFVGGTGEAGWLESDGERWEEAIGVLIGELRQTEGFEVLDGEEGRVRLRFVANVVIAVK